MGNVEAGDSAEHFDGGLEQDNGGGAVDVVVAVEKDGLAAVDGGFKAGDGGSHAEHQRWIVQMIDGGVKKGEGRGWRVDAAGEKQLREDERQARGLGQGFCFRVRLGEDPALAGTG
jgi:hypothetical protein